MLLDVVKQLDTSALHRRAKLGGAGPSPYDPDMLLTVLFYAYLYNVLSSHKIEKQRREDIAFMVLSDADEDARFGEGRRVTSCPRSFATLMACLPIVTAGTAVTVAGVAADRLCTGRELPSLRELLAQAGRGWRGAVLASGAAAVVAAMIAADFWLLGNAAIPGAAAARIALGLVTAGLAVVAAVTTVHIGRRPELGWLAALRRAAGMLRHRPLAGPAVLATLAVPALLAWAVPVLVPGLVLFALHVVIRRLAAAA